MISSQLISRLFLIIAALLLTLTANAGQFPIPDSGQTKCYDDAGDEINPCPQPGEPFYGQDANYSINPRSYTKLDSNGNDLADSAASWAMVRDNVTGLIWEVKTDDGFVHDKDNEYTWYDTDNFINELNTQNFGGFSEWRMPTVQELASITNKGMLNPAIDTNYFNDTMSSRYWSGTIDALYTDDAWFIHFYYGSANNDNKSSSYYVRAVRSGQSIIELFDNLVTNGDDTVTDKNTGLMWQKETKGEMSWQNALSYCESLSLGGKDDWRLPTVEELRSIVDYSTYSPATNTHYFNDTMSYYWSATAGDYDTGRAWGINFSSGLDHNGNKSNSYYVRAVRSGQSGSFDPLAISVNADKISGYTPLQITFSASISGGVPPYQFAWNFGDEETAQGSSATHVYYDAGAYTVVLNVVDNLGTQAESSAIITVNEAVTPDPPDLSAGRAIIISGGGAQASNTLFPYSTEQCQQMYAFLKQRGYSDGDICYMTPQIWQDINGDGRDDGVVDYQLFDHLNELEQAFDAAAAALSSQGQFVLYIHGHARQDNLMITRGNELTSAALNLLLSKIPSEVQQIIILDTCHSGSFMDELSAGSANRILVTSADADTSAWNVEYSSFSGKFIRSLRLGTSLGQAFYYTEDMIIANPALFRDQRPQLDDTGDGIYSSADGPLAHSIYIGGEGVEASEPPVIIEVHPRVELPENVASTTLWVKTSPENDGISKVRAILMKPGFSPSDYQGEDTQFGREELEMLYSHPQNRFEVNYDSFREKGVWTILYQAQGTDGAWSDLSSGSVLSLGIKTDATIAVNLNQPAYQLGDQLLFSVTANGQVNIDLYVAIMFPGGFFQTIIYPLNFSMTNSIMPYQTGIELAGEKTFPILDFILPKGIPHGTYTCYGIVTPSGSDPWEIESWIHFDYKTFEMK